MGDWSGSFLEVFLTLSFPIVLGDNLEVRDVAMPYRINTIHLKQGFQDSQFLIGHKGHGNA